MMTHTHFGFDNTVTLAKKQLAKHAKKGVESTLSIFEVARLMDLVRQEPATKKSESESIFFGFSQN